MRGGSYSKLMIAKEEIKFIEKEIEFAKNFKCIDRIKPKSANYHTMKKRYKKLIKRQERIISSYSNKKTRKIPKLKIPTFKCFTAKK